MARRKQQEVIVNKIDVFHLDRQQVDIQKWRSALEQAERKNYPIRKNLYQIFNELLLDAHLNAIYKKRIRNVKNTKISYFEEGKDTEQLNKDFFKAPWFIKLIRIIMETLFFGHSLIEFKQQKDFIADVHLIPRQHVHPKQKVISLNSYVPSFSASDNVPYTEDPYADYLLEVQAEDELGLFNIAAANTILKRNGTIDFANFVEIFGSPIREYRYDGRISGAREEAEQVARSSGNSSAIVLPQDYVSLNLHNGASSGNTSIHTDFLQMLKAELTVLFLGQTMTTENGSSRSQAEVHERSEQQVIREDKMFVEYVLNWDLKEKLIKLGLPISEKGYFSFVEENTLPIDKQLEMDLQLATVVDIEPDYFYHKYKIPQPKKKSPKPRS